MLAKVKEQDGMMLAKVKKRRARCRSWTIGIRIVIWKGKKIFETYRKLLIGTVWIVIISAIIAACVFIGLIFGDSSFQFVMWLQRERTAMGTTAEEKKARQCVVYWHAMKHQRCRCLGGMQPFHIHSNKLLYLSVQQSQCSIIVMQSDQSVLSTIELGVSTMSSNVNFSGPALLSCLTYQLLGSQLWIALPLNQCCPQLNLLVSGVSTMSSNVSTAVAYWDSFHSCLHNFSGPALLSCLTYQLLGSQLWIALPLKNSIVVSKLWSISVCKLLS